ncbi:MAG: hypothetical protein A3F31_02060 [Candidatus Levybacteria bacterium RIFCSPHIGHO2_12_FULL_38_12]|nr:MAG: hypothetical protein A2770_04015 [Candidatus Levybacteria bacterium RIFCSPHIGHO2_01_FULL_38_12]OGH22245.1 MAG: hypothetical protein A3F31_02060 [Candidatus Levybacteria bacterium RIFCSPHIGHO2_12_FULL_38_12]
MTPPAEKGEAKQWQIPVQVILKVSGLMPSRAISKVRLLFDRHPPEGEIVEETHIPDNLEEVAPEVAKAISERKGLIGLFEDVRDGERDAVFKVGAVGSLIILAAGIGYEFGLKDGRHVKELWNLI